MKLDKTTFMPFLFLALAPSLLLAGWIIIALNYKVEFVDISPLRIEFPDAIAGWHLVPILFCSNEQCLRSVELSDTPFEKCPYCQAPLIQAPPAEKAILPPDTIIRHGRFVRDNNLQFQASIIVAGESRASLHKPEWCLPGQGYRIADRSLMEIPLSKDDNMSVVLLSLEKDSSFGYSSKAHMAYWFVGHSKVTHSRVQMVFDMFLERLIKRKAMRWAYVTVLYPKTSVDNSDLNNLIKIIQELQNSLKKQ